MITFCTNLFLGEYTLGDILIDTISDNMKNIIIKIKQLFLLTRIFTRIRINVQFNKNIIEEATRLKINIYPDLSSSLFHKILDINYLKDIYNHNNLPEIIEFFNEEKHEEIYLSDIFKINKIERDFKCNYSQNFKIKLEGRDLELFNQYLYFFKEYNLIIHLINILIINIIKEHDLNGLNKYFTPLNIPDNFRVNFNDDKNKIIYLVNLFYQKYYINYLYNLILITYKIIEHDSNFKSDLGVFLGLYTFLFPLTEVTINNFNRTFMESQVISKILSRHHNKTSKINEFLNFVYYEIPYIFKIYDYTAYMMNFISFNPYGISNMPTRYKTLIPNQKKDSN